VDGGAETVIQGLLEAVGNRGTLLMPALGTDGTDTEPLFDQKRTPTWTGRIPEAFRTRAGTRRSIHPTHSVCAAGEGAEDILEGHINDSTPCGPNSPFRLLPELGGQLLMLGCGLKPNTSFHAVEECFEPPYLYGKTVQCRLKCADGTEAVKPYRMHGFAGWEQRYDRIDGLMSGPGLVRGRVLEARAYLFDASAMWDAARDAYQRDRLYFVERIPETRT
jgi:aminoglycoside 3-N-acetyltransferase